jgi:hypothetical protein
MVEQPPAIPGTAGFAAGRRDPLEIGRVKRSYPSVTGLRRSGFVAGFSRRCLGHPYLLPWLLQTAGSKTPAACEAAGEIECRQV